MKRTFTLLLMLTITTFIVTLGCDTGSSGDADDDSNNTIQFTEGKVIERNEWRDTIKVQYQNIRK